MNLMVNKDRSNTDRPRTRLAPDLQRFIDAEKALYEEQTFAGMEQLPTMAKAKSYKGK